MHLETATPKMLELAKVFTSHLDHKYYLSGGTALALQIGHRTSIDLDYFTSDHIDTKKLKNLLNKILPTSKINFVFEEKDTLWCTIDDVKVSFISRLEKLLKPVKETEYFKLASIEDITIMKLSAIVGREEYKDYFDLACLSEITDTRSWISWWAQVYPQSDPISFIIALSALANIKPVPLQINENFHKINVSVTLQKAVLNIQKFFE